MKTTASSFTEEPGKTPETLHWAVRKSIAPMIELQLLCGPPCDASCFTDASWIVLYTACTPLRPERPSDMGSFHYISAIQ